MALTMQEFQKNKIWQWLCATLLILVVPNIICWIVQTKVYMTRGIFVWEYLLLACFYPYINRKLFIVLWVLFAVYDLVFATSSMLFMDFFEIIHALAKIPTMPFVDWLKWAGLLILLVGVILAMLTVMMRYNKNYPFLRFAFLWPLIIGLLVVDFFNGQGPLRRWSVRLIHTSNNIVSVPTWSLFLSVRNVLYTGNAKKINVEYLGSVAQAVFAAQPDSIAEKKEVLVLVESWGLLHNRELQQTVLAPLYQLATNRSYTIREGSTHYKYLTMAGESREITGYLFHFYQAQEKWVKEKSLFIKKQQQGYKVIGVHGYSSLFYKRKSIWPALGVQEMYFAEDFKAMSMSFCGDVYFRGICDTSINTWLFNNMKSQPERKEFYYWVTLNTHFPLVEIHDNDYNLFAEKWKQQGISDIIIQMAYQHRLLFKDLAEKLSQPGMPKAHILLVGDHAPPFMDPVKRKMYDAQLVPYIELVPNR
jgi:hypothetical protein